MSEPHSRASEPLDDDDAPTPSLAEVAALMLRRSLRAAAAGRTAEAARLLRLHRDYRALEGAEVAPPARQESVHEVSEVHDVHQVHPVSPAGVGASRLRLSLLEATVAKAARRGDPAALRRAEHRLAQAQGPP